MFDVAYGAPERSVSEAQLRAALGVVGKNFDEAPSRMHAVLGPPGLGIRWFSFACTTFERGMGLAQDHFSEVLETELAELLVVVRRHSDEPATVEVRRTSARELTLVRTGETIGAYGLADDAARDGEIDEIALAALGLPIVRPFVMLATPRHQVILRGEDIDPTYPVVRLTKAVLPVRVNPRLGHGGAEQFTRTPRAVDAGNLEMHVQRVLAKAADDSRWHPVFDGKVHGYAREVVRAGPAVARVLVALLEQPKPQPRTSQLALTALGLLDTDAHAIVPWLARSAEMLRISAYCALARQGNAARAALATASTSRRSAERVGAQALLEVLDAPAFEPVRAARTTRDALDERARAEIAATFTRRELPQTLVFDGAARFAWYLRAAVEEAAGPAIDHALHFAPDDGMWPIALLLIEMPFASDMRDRIVAAATKRFGADFGPVVDVLLRFPPFERKQPAR